MTAVFADLSGFTALATRLDPEELQDVIDPVLLVLSRVIEGHGGQVEKYAGDAVLALFGVPVQYEDDALRAMRTAHDLHAALASVLPGLPPAARRLTLHVGVDSGHVVARLLGKELRLDYGVLGDCVVRAQRLESVTPAGETYVGESTWRLVRDHVALTDLGTRELKGFSAPVRAWRATAGVAAVTEGRLYGRQAELARAQEVLGAVRGPASSALLISGEAGAGKSRLIHELRTLAARQHLRWVQVAASSFGGSEPYALLVQVLRLVRPVVGGASDVLDVVAEGGLPPPGTDPEAFRIEVHAAVVGVLRQWATEPSVLVIEDLHWADASSSEALAAGLSALADLPVMVLASSRRADEPLLQVLGHPVRIELAALSDDSVGALVREMLDGTCPQAHVEDGVLAFVGQRSGGNPFFLRELVRALQEQGLLRLVDGRWAMDEAAAGAIPDTVDGVVAARLDALPGPARRVLQTCAVIGVEVQEALLRTLEPEMAEALAVLSTAGLLAPRGGGGWVFRHALLQEVAYSRLLRRSRKAIHQRVAEAILQVNGDADEVMDALARHLAQGARGPAALTASWRAATRAAGLFAHTEALSQLEVTLELAGENPDHEPGQSAVRSVMGDRKSVV